MDFSPFISSTAPAANTQSRLKETIQNFCARNKKQLPFIMLECHQELRLPRKTACHTFQKMLLFL